MYIGTHRDRAGLTDIWRERHTYGQTDTREQRWTLGDRSRWTNSYAGTEADRQMCGDRGGPTDTWGQRQSNRYTGTAVDSQTLGNRGASIDTSGQRWTE